MNEMADIGLVGLAVMGENLSLNMAGKGFRVAVFNRTVSKVDAFIAGRARGKNITGTRTLKEFTSAIKKPRKIMMMIRAGKTVDEFIEQILPFLDKGDILIDGGNSHYRDTMRRTEYLEGQGLLFVGTGISGGEQGALHGPSIMPGGSAGAWPEIKPIFQGIAAKLADGTPCCEWIGSGGAGHFVKMVHNGIEYGDMQLIAECYQVMRELLGMTPGEMQPVFAEWNKGELESYLVEITGHILAYKDEDGSALVEKIMDKAGQKGTGKWAAALALDMDIPLTLIGEAVFARYLSDQKEERVRAARLFSPSRPAFKGDRDAFIHDLGQALYAAKIVSYTQGFALLRAAAQVQGWELDYQSIASIWRNGCIIRSAFLQKIMEAFQQNPRLANLLLDAFFKQAVSGSLSAWRRVAAQAVGAGVSVPALLSALSYFDGYVSDRLPANLIQAQRDYFGAHMYERIDKPQGEFFHTDWTGEGGGTRASVYTV